MCAADCIFKRSFVVGCTGVVVVSLSGYLIDLTQTWAIVFSLIALINATGLGVFMFFGDAQRIDQDKYSPLTVI